MILQQSVCVCVGVLTTGFKACKHRHIDTQTHTRPCNLFKDFHRCSYPAPDNATCSSFTFCDIFNPNTFGTGWPGLLAEHVHPSLQFDSLLVGNPPCVEHTQKTLITFIVIYSQFIFDRHVNSEINVSFYRSQMQIRVLCTALQLFLCMVFHTPS